MIRQTNCCGLYEFSGFNYFKSAKEVVQHIIAELVSNGWGETKRIEDFPPVILFTDTKKVGGSSGEKLEKFIKIKKLGSIKKTPYRLNPNSGNKIQCYLWTLNKKNLKSWDKKQK